MADFQFEVEISAKIAELEQALNKAANSTQKAADQIADAVENKADPAFENLLKTIGKVGAGLFLAEGAFKIGTAALRGLSGDADAARQALQSIPVVGPLITSFLEFGDALISLASSASEAAVKMLELELASKRAEAAASVLASKVQANAEQLKLLGADDARIQEQLISDRIRLLEMAHKKRLEQIHDQRVAESELIMSRNLSIDDEERLLREVRDVRYEAIKAADEELRIQKQNLEISLDIAKAQREQTELQREQNKLEEKRAETAEKVLATQEKIAEALKKASQAAADFMTEALKKAKELEEQNKRAAKVVEDVNESLDRRMRKTQAEGDPVAERELEKQLELEDLRKKFEEEIRKAREAGNKLLEKQLEKEKRIAEEKLRQIQALEDQKSAAESADEAAKKAADEEKKRAEEAAKIAQAQKELEEEVAIARQDAQKQAAAATVSFSTAGGTFVTGANAQVNESKILNQIQKKSQALLERIAANTGRAAVGFG